MFLKARSNGHNICHNILTTCCEPMLRPFTTHNNVVRCCDMLWRVWIILNFVSTSSQHFFCSWNVVRLLWSFNRAWWWSQHVATCHNMSQQMLWECCENMLWPFDRALINNYKEYLTWETRKWLPLAWKNSIALVPRRSYLFGSQIK